MSSSPPPSFTEAYSEKPKSESKEFVVWNESIWAVALVGSAILFLLTFMLVGFMMGAFQYPTTPLVSIDSAPDTPISVQGVVSGESDASVLYDVASPSVVSVYTYSDISQSQGTGFVSTDGHIITNEHVVENGDTFYVRYAEGEWAKASLVGADENTDVAVLRPNNRPNYAVPLTISPEPPRVGEHVVVIGNPENLQGSITRGIISGTERTLQLPTGYLIPDMIQTDAALNPGNSGGPLLSTEGEVVGIVTARQGDNIGFAVSGRVTQRIVDSIIKSGGHEHPRMGITMRNVDPIIAEENGLERVRGVIVQEVSSEGPSGGKLQGSSVNDVQVNGRTYTLPVGGDIIVAIDNNTIDDSEDLGSYLIRKTSPGDTVTVTVIRNGQTQDIDIELGKR